MIKAPDAVVSLWEAEAVRALAAADRATDRLAHLGLPYAAAEVRVIVADLASALTRAASVLRGSAIQATPEGAAVFLAGLDRLAAEVADLPLGGFTPGSGLAWKDCADLPPIDSRSHNTQHARARPIDLPLEGDFSCCAGDSGCEGGTS